MRYLKLYESFDNKNPTETELVLLDICYILKLYGYNVDIDIEDGNNKISSIIIDRLKYSYQFSFSEVKEYLLRIKDYLGNNYINFSWLLLSGWEEVELNESLEMSEDKNLYAVSIQYNNMK